MATFAASSPPVIAGFVSRLRRGATSAAASALLAVGLASGAAEAAHIAMVNIGQPDTAALLMTGQIVQGDLGRLRAAVANVPAGKKIVLMLESPGGSVDEGLAMGRFVHATKITTIAIEGPGCASPRFSP